MAIPCSTKLTFTEEYEIFVYDTLNKEIIYKSAGLSTKGEPSLAFQSIVKSSKISKGK